MVKFGQYVQNVEKKYYQLTSMDGKNLKHKHMKRYYNSKIYDNKVYLATVPLKNLTFTSLVNSMNELTSIDTYTVSNFRNFVEEGYNDFRVKHAQDIQVPDQMILYSTDIWFTNPTGLAICFNNKFFRMPFTKEKYSEMDEYNIFCDKTKSLWTTICNLLK